MGGFPALPSGNNPYAASAAGYASSAASVFNAIRSAAAAHEQTLYKRKQDAAAQQAADLQQSFKNQLELVDKGGQENPNTGSTHPNGPTLKRDDNPQPGDAAPTPQGAGAVLTEPISGKQYRMRTKGEQEQDTLNDSNSFVPTGQLGAMMESAGWKKGARVKPGDSHSILQALNAAQPQDEGYDIDSSGKYLDAQGNPTAVMIGKKTGKVKMLDFSGAQPSQPQQPRPQSAQAGDQYPVGAPGTGVQSPGYEISGGAGQAGGPFSFALPEKADKPDVSQIIPGQQGPNGGMLIYDKNSQTAKEIPLPKGSKPVMTAAQTEADKDRHERQADRQDASKMKPAEARLIVKTKADRIAKADAEYKKALGTAITPQDRSEALADRQREYQGAQNEYEESISAATGQQVPHNSWADTPAAKTDTGAGRGGKTGTSGTSGTSGTRQAPPAAVTQGLKPGVHTFGNGQVWKKNADGSMVYVSGGQ